MSEDKDGAVWVYGHLARMITMRHAMEGLIMAHQKLAFKSATQFNCHSNNKRPLLLS
jgi:hypothetical protein